MHHFKIKSPKIFWRGGIAPSPDPTPGGKGTPHTPAPSCLWPLALDPQLYKPNAAHLIWTAAAPIAREVNDYTGQHTQK